MTEAIKIIKSNILLRSEVIGQERRLPKIYIVGQNHYWFYNAARRAAHETGEKIEVITYEHAYRIIHGHEPTVEHMRYVDNNFDQTGEIFDNKCLFCNNPKIKVL